MGNSLHKLQKEDNQLSDVMQTNPETVATNCKANVMQPYTNGMRSMNINILHRAPPPPTGAPPLNQNNNMKHHKTNGWPQHQAMNQNMNVRMPNQQRYTPHNTAQSTPWNQPQITDKCDYHNKPSAVPLPFQKMQSNGFIASQVHAAPSHPFNHTRPPSSECVNPYGDINAFFNPNRYHNPVNTETMYYMGQPHGGGDTIVPPPPMAMSENGELRPKKKKKKKKKRKHRRKKPRRRHRDHHKDMNDCDRQRSRSRGKRNPPASPPPPPPPSSRLLPPNGGTSSSSTDVDDIETKTQFIRRRPVSRVFPMSVLNGIKDDKISSHLKLIHRKNTNKTVHCIRFLKECLLKEVLFEGMDDAMMNEIVQIMYRVDCPRGECIVRQNEYGDAYFVIESGTFNIIHQATEHGPQTLVGEMVSGNTFGEGSLLYSIPRAATAKATTACVVWALDATKYVEIRQKVSQQVSDKTASIVRHLQKIALFKKYHHQDLVVIAHAVIERKYAKHARIVNQGTEANEFYVIKTGAAIAVITTADGKEQTVKKYSDGDFFGERGIYKNETRAASIIATSTTRCYVITAADFNQLLSDPLSKEFEATFKTYDEVAFDAGITRPFRNLISCTLATLNANTLGILGVGAFGRVSLVKDPQTNRTYSLKKIGKNKVIETGQQEHVRNERAVLATLNSDFCVKLFGTFQDKLNIYFLMEPVLGGEFFSVLRWNKRLSEKNARFYAACVVLAFEALHSKNIIYRDLKPENVLIAQNGYCKLVDFGFAKKRNNSCTLCGTPEYLSPEVIQHGSQGFALDWWTLGIFLYEMVAGYAPFKEDIKVNLYEKILTYDVEFEDDLPLTPRVQHLILGLLEKDSFQRLGAGANGMAQIVNHPWFQGLDWDAMRQQKLTPPYVPSIVNREDLSNYDFDEQSDEKMVENDTLDPQPSLYEWCEDF